MKKIDVVKEELDNKIPDIKKDIVCSVDWQKIELDNQKQKSKTKLLFKILVPVCCAFIICLSVFMFMMLNNNVSYSLIINVNPSIKLILDKNDRVTKQIPLNKDAVVFLYKNNYLGIEIKQATKNILVDMKLSGISANNVKISLKDDGGKVATTKQDNIFNYLEEYLKNDNIDVVLLKEEEIENIIENYENNKVSDYEKNFINTFRTKLEVVLNKKVEKINELLNDLQIYNKESEDLIVDFSEQIKTKLSSFSTEYNYRIDLDYSELLYIDVFEFCKDLNEHKIDLIDEWQEINEENDEYGELLEDLFELVKEDLFEEN